MKDEVDVLGSPLPAVPRVSVDVSATLNLNLTFQSLPSPSEFRSCVNVEVVVLGSPSLTVLTLSADVRQR